MRLEANYLSRRFMLQRPLTLTKIVKNKIAFKHDARIMFLARKLGMDFSCTIFFYND